MAQGYDDDKPRGWSPTPITERMVSTYVGKYILVGITKEDAFGNEVDRYQIHGVIESLAPNEMVRPPVIERLGLPAKSDDPALAAARPVWHHTG